MPTKESGILIKFHVSHGIFWSQNAGWTNRKSSSLWKSLTSPGIVLFHPDQKLVLVATQKSSSIPHHKSNCKGHYPVTVKFTLVPSASVGITMIFSPKLLFCPEGIYPLEQRSQAPQRHLILSRLGKVAGFLVHGVSKNPQEKLSRMSAPHTHRKDQPSIIPKCLVVSQ